MAEVSVDPVKPECRLSPESPPPPLTSVVPPDAETTFRPISWEENARRTRTRADCGGHPPPDVKYDPPIPREMDQLVSTDHSVFTTGQSNPGSLTKLIAGVTKSDTDVTKLNTDAMTLNTDAMNLDMDAMESDTDATKSNPGASNSPEAAPTYRILDGVSTRGRRKLVDDQGYSYTVKRELGNGRVNWWCSVRNKSVRCRAAVSQRKDQFTPGTYDHCHPPVPLKLRPERRRKAKPRPTWKPAQTRDPKLDRPFEDSRRYRILDGVSERGKRKLVDDRGYSYSPKQRRVKGTVIWSCSVRNKKVYCYATVSQHGDRFRRGQHEHNHPPTPGLATSLSIRAKVRQEAPKNLDQPVSEIIENVLGELLPESEQDVAVPKQACLVKAAQRARARVLSSQTQDSKRETPDPDVGTSPQSPGSLSAAPSDPDVSRECSSQYAGPEADPALGVPCYQILEGVSERGHPKLVDHRGYSYTFKRKRPSGKVDWICSVRNKNVRCHAAVCQQGDQFHMGKYEHNHPPMPGIATYLSVRAKVKEETPRNLSLPATEIVEKVLGEITQDNESNVTLPSQTDLIRAVNRTRLRYQPRRPRPRRPSFSSDEPTQAASGDCAVSNETDQSFDFGHSIFTQTGPHEQSGLNAELTCNNATIERPRYQILEGGSERGKGKLVDGRGYAYTLKRKLVNGDFSWWCCVRNKKVCCRASVTQRGHQFRQGYHEHCHPPQPGLATTLAIKAKVKQEAPHNICRPAPALVEKVLSQLAMDSEPCTSLPTQTCLVRTVNRARERYLQQHTTGSTPSDKSDDSFTIDHSVFVSDDPYEQSIQYSSGTPNQEYIGGSQYNILDGASVRGKQKLVDDQGFTYTKKRQVDDGKVYWWCTVRNKTIRCRATVLQQGNHFQRGLHPHCHGPTPTKSKVKQEACKEVFRTTQELEPVQVMAVQEDYPIHLLMGGLDHPSQL